VPAPVSSRAKNFHPNGSPVLEKVPPERLNHREKIV
jgi:hypothetical protein